MFLTSLAKCESEFSSMVIDMLFFLESQASIPYPIIVVLTFEFVEGKCRKIVEIFGSIVSY